MRNKIFVTLFFLILTLPFLDQLFAIAPVRELFEKRMPVEKPAFPADFAEFKSYPKNFEQYFNDNYGFRKTLINFNNHLMDRIFDESPDVRAMEGKDSWFYFDNHGSILDAQGKAVLDDEMVDRAVKSFYRNWQNMQKENIDYLLIIAADKASIYPEFLPDYIHYSEKNHRIDKFLDALRAKYPDFPVLDLRPILKNAKNKEIVYQKTDTHWNKRGSHYAYVEMMKILAKKDPRFRPHLRSEFFDKADEYIKGDISDIMGNENTNLNYDLAPKFKVSIQEIKPSLAEIKQFHKPIFFENNNKNLPVIFVYKDSYFADLMGYVSEHFSHSYYINEFPCDVNLEIIKKYHPNVLIQEFWEGRVELVLKRCKL